MSRSLLLSGRFAVAAFLVSIFSLSGYGQLQLREALDFDGDLKADYTIFRPSQNTWYILGSLGGVRVQQWGLANEDRAVPGDYDGDNRADLAVWRDSQGFWYILNSTNFTFTGVHWGTSGDVPVARDYDGDGKTDQAIVRRSPGKMTWWIKKSMGGSTAFQWGLDSDFACPGDYDGDGKFDLCVQRPGATSQSQAVFYVLGSQVGFFAIAWGIGSDYVVPGDYNNDNKTDFAVVREGATGSDALTWYILLSNQGGVIVRQWGLTSDDYNAQGDYDGDGKTDIAVWRQSNGTFYVLRSSNNFNSWYAIRWGMEGDLPLATYDTF